MEHPLHVVATAGHVDHGKSSLIERLTGIDPDRWSEEKRRGLTIDLGFAWATLPSGREIGFVDVPGHERFIRNMLAGVGPVRLALFVVAADEGWKPQSEEHLEILDVLGAHAAVVALSKADLVSEELLRERHDQVRERLAGTALADAPLVACSATTGAGMDELLGALDDMVGDAPAAEDTDRPRIHIDRSFTIRGAGTVVTGTLTGGSLAVGDHVVILPGGMQARIRSLQTHRRSLEAARPVSRVAANLVGLQREDTGRGDVLVRPGQWQPTGAIDVTIRPVRSVRHALTSRGAYKVYAGSAERDARLSFHGEAAIAPGEEGFARLRLSAPIVVAAGDRFALREAGRRETVGGGIVLDPNPPARAGADVTSRLATRLETPAGELPSLVVRERGAVRARELATLTGTDARAVDGATPLGGWWVADPLRRDLEEAATAALDELHRSSPLLPGMDAADVREAMLGRTGGAALEEVAAAVLAALEADGTVRRTGTVLRRSGHAVSLGDRQPDADRLVELVAGGEPTPPTQRELEASGFDRELIDACVSTGLLARVSPDVVVTPDFLAGAEKLARAGASSPDGMTVSRFRELLGTTRKYALPILGFFDERGITVRRGDVRHLRD